MTKPSIFVTRRWPAAAEAALSEHFTVTFNEDDSPLSKDRLIEGFATHDIAAPTVSDASMPISSPPVLPAAAA